MHFQPFYKKIKEFRPIFCLNDLKILFSDQKITSVQLSRWQEQGKIIKLRNGVYLLEEYKNFIHNFLIANLLYYPSYVSLESALYEYGFIPDVTQSITSVTSKKTLVMDVMNVRYDYKKIKKDCFIGYFPSKYLGYDVLMAEPEKAVVDFLYFNKFRLKNDDQINELRFNFESLRQKINKEKVINYALLYRSSNLNLLVKNILSKF